MREIKFRLWDKKNKKFILNTKANPLELLSGITLHGILQYGISYFDIENITISQYTGLKDIVGNEIYEHDLVMEYNILKKKREPGIRVCSFDLGCVNFPPINHAEALLCEEYDISFNSICILPTNARFLIIGNILESPELVGETMEQEGGK